MAALRLSQFLGERPGLHPQKLKGFEAQVARNVRVLSQALEPFRARSTVVATHGALTPRTIFRDRNGTWLQFAERVGVANSIVGNDPFDRVFFTSSQGPRVSDSARRMSGPGPYPGASLVLGVPALTNAPSASITNIGDAEGNELSSRVYTVTLVNSYGEEGPPSPASNLVSVYPGATVAVSLPNAPGGAYDFTSYYIYRFVDGAYQFVGSAPIASATFDDTQPTDLAQEPLESVSWSPPPSDAKGLVSVAGNYLAAFRRNQLLLSEQDLPHAWPIEYRQTVDHDIVGLGTFGNTVVLCTKGPLHLGMGALPSSIIVSETGVNEACVAEESIVSMAGGVCYASPNGLVFVTDGGISVPTAQVMTEKEWRTFNPASIRATSWNSIYIASYEVAGVPGAFMFDPRTPEAGIFWLDLPRASALYTHVESDRMYMVDAAAATIQEWDADPAGAFASFRWRSRPFDLSAPAPLNVAQVKADSYPVTLRVFADGVLQAAVSVPDIRPLRVSGGRLARSYAVEVEGTRRTYEIAVATSVSEIGMSG